MPPRRKKKETKMVTTSKLTRQLVAFLLVWIIGTLIVSFSVTHNDNNDPELLDAGESRGLLDLDEQEPQPQVQVQSPSMLMKHRDRKSSSRINSSSQHQIHTEHKLQSYFGKQQQRSHPQSKKNELLPADFVSPAAGRATMCAVRTKYGACAIQPCQQQQQQPGTASAATGGGGGGNDTNTNNTIIPVSDWHYGHGLVHRDNDLRGTTMITSGQAAVGSGCAMSVKYKFIYVHVLKSAGMTIKAFLKRALCGGSTGQVTPCFESDNDNDNEKLGDYDEPVVPLLEIVNCAAALQEHPDYFVWSFVRNPFARLYSGYSMADNFRHHGRNTDITDKPAFTFAEFSLASQAARSRMTAASNSHFLPQTNFLFSRSSCPVFDFVGRLEHLEEDLQTVLAVIGSPELTDYVRSHNGTIHHERDTAYGSSKSKTELHGDLRNAYSVIDAGIDAGSDMTVQAAAAVEFARDFQLLGYNPNVIPVTKRTTAATK